jgi:ComF family protein
MSGRLSFLLDWLYPPRCRFCRASILKDEDTFCPPCLEKIRLVTHPLCGSCGRPFLDTAGADHLCGACLTRVPYFHMARAWACYPSEEREGHPLREVVQRFKYGRKISLGKPLGRLLARASREFLAEHPANVVVPVPLHPKRLRWRGFNQALILGREVARQWKVPMDPFILERHRETPPQTQLDEEERRKNMRGAFSANSAKSVEGNTILLVDDV